MADPLSPEEQAVLKLIFDEIQQDQYPNEQDFRRRSGVQPWIVDSLLQKGLLHQRPHYLGLTIKGLQVLGTPEAERMLDETRLVLAGLQKARRQDASKTWGTSDLANLIELPARSGRDVVIGRLLPLLNPYGMFFDITSTQAGLISGVQIHDNVFDVDPFAPPSQSTDLDLTGDVTLSIQNFRGVRAAEWSFDGVNLLAGANGSGKTTLLEALFFFLSYYHLDWNGAANVLGGYTGLKYLMAPAHEPIVLSLQVGAFRWTVELAQDLSGTIDPNPGEQVLHGEKVILRRIARSAAWYLGSKKRQNNSGVCCLRLVAESDYPQAELLQPLAKIIKSIRVYHSYNLSDIRALPDKPNGDEYLRGSGQNLYAVLRNWQGAPRRFEERFAWVMEHLQRAFPRLITHIEFDSAGSIVLANFFPEGISDPGQHLPLQSASDGMLVGLLHLTAVAGCEEGDIIAIDEMENQLHPHAIRTILKAIREIAEKRSLRVLLTTHSPVLMNDFKQHPEQFFVTEAKDDRFPVPLDDLHDPEWLAHFSLGDLYDRMEFGAPETKG